MSSDLGTIVYVVDADEEAKPAVALVTDTHPDNADLVTLLVFRPGYATGHVMENVPLFDSEPDARETVGRDTPWHACRAVASDKGKAKSAPKSAGGKLIG